MDPNQQPAVPSQEPTPEPQPQFSPAPQQPAPSPINPVAPTVEQPLSQPSPAPLAGSDQSFEAPGYVAPAPIAEYDPNYLDSIAPAPPQQNFFSGSFGKIFFAMIAVFVFAVSLIIAFSGKDKTADLQQTTVRITNFVLLTKTEQPYLTSNKLQSTNSSFTLILTNAQTDGESLLKQAGVQKSQYSKTMVAGEKKLSTDLTSKFEDSRLNANLNSDYARTMAAETQKLIVLFTTMSKQSQASKIRSYAKNLATNLVSIQKSFDGYVDDGN